MRSLNTALFAAAVLATASGLAAPADRWVTLGQDRDGEYSYDPQSISRNGNRAEVLVRAVLAQSPDQPPMSMVARQEIDCVKQTSATLSVQRFGAGPEPLRSRTIPPEHVEREPLFAGSHHAGLYRLLCPKGRRLSKFSGPPIVMVPRKE